MRLQDHGEAQGVVHFHRAGVLALLEEFLDLVAQGAQHLAVLHLAVLLAEDVHGARVPLQRHDLALQALRAALPVLFAHAAGASRLLVLVPLEQAADRPLELLGAERLGHVLVGAAVLAPEDVLLLAAGGEEDHGGRLGGRVRLDAAADLEAVHLRHHDVDDQQVGPLLAQLLQRLLAVLRQDHAVAQRLEVHLQDLADARRVVGHQDLAGHAAVSSTRPRRAGGPGSPGPRRRGTGSLRRRSR